MYWTFGKPKNIQELNTPSFNLLKPKRNEVPILVIDDEDIPYLEDIRNHGFNFTRLNDIDQIESVKGFEIVLCDIRGIGKKFKSKFEGAHIISEIKKVFPYKIVIAYTAYTFDPTYNKYFNIADDVFRKDIDRDEWIEKLDNAIEMAINPITKWIKIRNFLQEQNISSVDIIKLEDEYVDMIQRKRRIDSFPSKRLKRNLSSNVQDVINSFLGSLFLKLLLG
jgi:hypothetical protein